MVNLRRMNDASLSGFRNHLSMLTPDNAGQRAPAELIDGELFTELLSADVELDESLQFSTRFDFARYLFEKISPHFELNTLMSPESDGLWAWLAALYFSQLNAKLKRSEHYIVTRFGVVGSLAYRHGVRNSYEFYALHFENARLVLGRKMHVYGDLAEQICSRPMISQNKSLIDTASHLYVNRSGGIKSKAASKPKKKHQRAPGDKTGSGGMRRLVGAFNRLDLSYDTRDMVVASLIAILPSEFRRFSP